MDWRKSLLRRCGPGVLGGITLPDWRVLRRTPGLEIDPPYRARAFCIAQQAWKNSLFAGRERRRFDRIAGEVRLQPPLFILGHWRSGTTLLHEFFSQDRRFAFPTSYETAFPHIFLTAERLESPVLSLFIPKGRPMDNMHLSMTSPQEDEFALCASTQLSPCMGWVFPRQRERFEKYLAWRNVDPAEKSAWKTAFLTYLKKLQFRHGPSRPLVLKSPQHTARVRTLLNLFPEARFVHICRDPYRVFLSSRSAFPIIFEWHCLQKPRLDDLDDWVLRQYATMYQAFHEEKHLIPSANYCELKFEDLEADPVREMGRIYRALDLPEFSKFEPALRVFVARLRGYRKNSFPEIEPALRARIGEEWKSCFTEWGYAC